MEWFCLSGTGLPGRPVKEAVKWTRSFSGITELIKLLVGWQWEKAEPGSAGS